MTAADIQAIRDALAAGPTSGPWWVDDDIAGVYINKLELMIASVQAMDPHPTDAGDFADGPITEATGRYIAAVHPERIARLLAALEDAQRDAERYRWLAANKSKRIWNHVLDEPQGNFLSEAVDAAMKDAP